jgi:hypothetical protein
VFLLNAEGNNKDEDASINYSKHCTTTGAFISDVSRGLNFDTKVEILCFSKNFETMTL